MKITIKAIVFFSLLLVVFSLFAISISAKSVFQVECNNADYADAIYFYSYDAKTVLFLKNEKKIVSPASTVKIMTGLISCERLVNRLDESVIITKDMLVGGGGISMGLKAGAAYSIRDLLYGAICGGCNDAAQALAVISCGSIDAFVEEMNRYAASLDMNATIYKNPTGLDENGAQTSAFDVAILSKIAIKNNLYMDISSAKNYYYTTPDGDEAIIYNRNALISHFTATQYLNEHASGLNAGSTDDGGYVVSTLLKASGSTYLCIVMGAEYEGREIYSYKIVNELMNTALASFGRVKISSKNEVISSLSVDCALSTSKDVTVSCITESDIFAFLPKNIDLKKRLEYRAYFHDTDLIAPITEGDVLGGLNIYLDGVLVGTTRIISDKSVEENSFLVFMKDMRGFLLSRYFLIFLLALIPTLTLCLYYDYTHSKRKRIGYIRF